MKLKQSVCYPMYASDDLSHADFFKRIKEIGFDAVEFWGRDQYGDHKELFSLAQDAGLGIASMIGHGALGDGLNNPENHDRIYGEIVDSLEVASRFSVPGFICFSGNRMTGQSDLEGMRACAAILRKVAPMAEDAGVNLNVELLNSKVNHPNYQCDHSDWGYALCDMVGSSHVKVLFDIYHMQIMEGDLISGLTGDLKYVGHIHTAGNPGRGPIDDTQEINYAGICHALREAGYGGYVGHEFAPRLGPLEDLAQAYRICSEES